MTVIDQLLKDGLIESVPADSDTAHMWIADATRHLEAAQRIIEIDRAGAYSLSYDAARKSLTAHMLASGWRPRSVPGAHWAVARYAAALPAAPAELGRFDDMRRTRNRSEYGVRVLGHREVSDAIDTAAAIVRFVRADLETN